MKAEREPVDELYFSWLCQQATRVRKRGYIFPYTIVCARMHKIAFKADVPNDDNRAAEGYDLRSEFALSLGTRPVYVPTAWREFEQSPATILEVLIALARRCDFQVELGIHEWFFLFLTNLHLDRFEDNNVAQKEKNRVSAILSQFNNRTYSPSGAGGLFPLKHPTADQRHVELWYQMSYYILENNMIL